MTYNNKIIDMTDVIADQGFYLPGDAIYIYRTSPRAYTDLKRRNFPKCLSVKWKPVPSPVLASNLLSCRRKLNSP